MNLEESLALLRPNALQGTNDYSMVSKCSACQTGYYPDQFVKHFVSKVSRRAPIIHWGYYIRYRAVQLVLSSFCRWGQVEGNKGQVVVLGAGFDTAYLRLRAEGLTKGVLFVEVDFPLVVENKERLLAASGLEGEGWYLVGQDLRDTKSLLSKLRAIPTLDLTLPTLFVSEVVLTYMRPSQSSRLIKWAALNFPNSAFCVYEQVYTQDPFGLVMMQHYRSIGSPLHTAAQYETPRLQEARFLALAYQHARAIDMNSFFYDHTPDPEGEASRLLSLEPFDEYEEWHQKCSHYTVLLAGRGKGTEFIASLSPPADYKPPPPLPVVPSCLLFRTLPPSPLLTRHSHASCYNACTGSVWLAGGYGAEVGGAHGRVCSVGEVRLSFDGSTVECKSARAMTRGEGPGGLMHCTLSALPDGNMVLVGGRRSPKAPNVYTYLLSPDCAKGGSQAVWSRMGVSDVTPEARWRHSAIVVPSGGEVRVLIHGGVGVGGVVQGDTWYLDTSTQEWSRVITEDSDSLAKVHSHSAVVWNDSLLVYGGLTQKLMPSSRLLRLPYKESNPVWKHIQFDPPLPARYSHSSVVIAATLYSLGGVGLHLPCYCSLLVVSLERNTWSDTDLCPLCPPLRTFLPYNFTAELVNNSRQLIVVGGGGNCFSFGTHINSQPWIIRLPLI